MDSFFTISQNSESEAIRIKGSKFIGIALSLEKNDDTKEKLQEIREQFTNASHYCYALRLGKNGETYRLQDDGEPKGSAAMPIYNQILSKNVSNILVVVVRYYGGTKLGVSGLIKAYKSAAKECLENAKVVEEFFYKTVEISFNYDSESKVNQIIKKQMAQISQREYNPTPKYKIKVLESKNQVIQKQLQLIKGLKIIN